MEVTGELSGEEVRARKRARAEAEGRVIDLAADADTAARASLDALIQQFVDASEAGFAVVPQIGQRARRLAEETWNGQRMMALPTAISRARDSGLLDRALANYKHETIPGLDPRTFDVPLFVSDIENAVSSLKRFEFAHMRSCDFDNIQAIATKTLRKDGANCALQTIQTFFLNLVNLNAELRDTANAELLNTRRYFARVEREKQAKRVAQQVGAAAAIPATAKLEPASPLIYKPVRHWPEWPDASKVAWARLFAPKTGLHADGHWLTPRMAAKLYETAVVVPDYAFDGRAPSLPRVARRFWKSSARWRENFLECYRRIASRLVKGLKPSPNCTGEEMALHNIVTAAVDAEQLIMDSGNCAWFDRLPKYENDDDFDMVSELATEDSDVLGLFEQGDLGHSDEEQDEGAPLSSEVAMMLNKDGLLARQMDYAFLHPDEWFHAFKEDCFKNHL
jgi:hypothetical protein